MPDSPSAISNPPSPTQPPRLEHPVRLSAHSWPEGTVPVVTICCITYNHEKFVRDAIEGFLMQETTFPVEIFIHDDASTDGTQDIIREYAGRHPKLFKLVLQTENQYSKHGFTFLNEYLFNLPGKYVATCEGDDYWISKDKLEKQASMLDANNHLAGVCHEVFTGEPRDKYRINGRLTSGEISLSDLLKCNQIPTLSVLIRSRFFLPLPSIYQGLPMGDWPTWITAAHHGPFWFDIEPMAYYRQHIVGTWSRLAESTKHLHALDLLCRASTLLDDKHKRDSIEGISYFFSRIHNFSLTHTQENLLPVASSFVSMAAWSKSEILKVAGKYLLETAWVENAPAGRDDLPIRPDVEAEMIASMTIASDDANLPRRILSARIAKQAWVRKLHDQRFALALLHISARHSFSTCVTTLFNCAIKAFKSALYKNIIRPLHRSI
jgi:glycosyltransferase involved in cell wall biosynthesis